MSHTKAKAEIEQPLACPWCGKKGYGNAYIGIRCGECGFELLPEAVALAQVARRSAPGEREPDPTLDPDRGTLRSSYCQTCGRRAITAHAGFEQNIGALVLRWHREVEGDLCFLCLNRYFWTFTPVTLLLGWWGVFSFFSTLVALPMNVISYLFALPQYLLPARGRPAAPGYRPPSTRPRPW